MIRFYNDPEDYLNPTTNEKDLKAKKESVLNSLKKLRGDQS